MCHQARLMRVPFLQDRQAIWGQVPAPAPAWGSGAPGELTDAKGCPGGPALQPWVLTVSPHPPFEGAGVCQAC